MSREILPIQMIICYELMVSFLVTFFFRILFSLLLDGFGSKPSSNPWRSRLPLNAPKPKVGDVCIVNLIMEEEDCFYNWNQPISIIQEIGSYVVTLKDEVISNVSDLA